MEWFTGQAQNDPDKQERLKEILMGLFSNKGNSEAKPLKFGEVPPKSKGLGFTPKKQDKALDQRDKEAWRRTRRSI